MMMKHAVLSFCRRHRPSSSPLIRVLRRRRLVTVSSGSRFRRCFDKRTSHSFFVSSRVGFFSFCFFFPSHYGSGKRHHDARACVRYVIESVLTGLALALVMGIVSWSCGLFKQAGFWPVFTLIWIYSVRSPPRLLAFSRPCDLPCDRAT